MNAQFERSKVGKEIPGSERFSSLELKVISRERRMPKGFTPDNDWSLEVGLLTLCPVITTEIIEGQSPRSVIGRSAETINIFNTKDTLIFQGVVFQSAQTTQRMKICEFAHSRVRF